MSEALTASSLCEGLGAADDVVGFGHTPGTRVVFGAGTVAQTGELAKELGGSRALIVTDPGIAKAGHTEWAKTSLDRVGISVTQFDEVHENPTTEDVAKCVAAAQAADIDIIIGLGGGSSMDTAKGANFILTNGGEMKDYWGVGKATQPMLPLIAIPTTAGTGSECQSFALIADAETHMKMACGDKKAAARIAILDPELTLTQPALVTAHTGIDAITHAVETFVTNKRTPTSSAYAKLAFQLLEPSLEHVIREPRDLEARARMQLGAAYAGTAIENSMLGAAHAAANPLTAHHGVVHGEAVGMMLPHVVRFNTADPPVASLYAELCDDDLPGRIVGLLQGCGMPTSLVGAGVGADTLPALAKEAAAQWTANFNPVAVTASDFENFYGQAL